MLKSEGFCLTPSGDLQQNLDLTKADWTDVISSPFLNLSNLQNQVPVPLPAAGSGF